MRKLWIVGIIAGAMSLASCGGHDKVYYNTNASASTNGIPNVVINQLYSKYPAAHDVDWKVKDGLYNADFDVDGKNMNASFSPDGNLVKVSG